MGTPAPPRSRTRARLAIAGVVLLTAGLAGCQASDPPEGPASMEDRASEVMPFDLTATTHTFTKTDTGGVQEVVAHDPDDTENITLVRSHLAEEVSAFQDGDFSDPATIHGPDMAGLAELSARAEEIEVGFEEIEAGGRITYTATDPGLIEALHAWFDHQNADHSMPGMGG